MTRDSLKEYLMQISVAEGLAGRWDPEILCELVDYVSDEDILGLIQTPRVCENCKYMTYWTETDIAECSANEPHLNYETMKKLPIFEVSYSFGCNKWEAR